MSSVHDEKHFGDEPFPRKPLLGAFALVIAALAAVTVARVTKLEPAAAPATDVAIVAERDLRFEDRADGSIAVIDAADGALVDTLAPGSNNFIRGTLRSLVRERRSDGIGAVQAFRLTARQDGHLLLTDPATARRIDLGSFGPTNLQSFARLLPARSPSPAETARLGGTPSP